MKKNLLLAIGAVFFCGLAYSQPGQWTWLHGSNFAHAVGNYGSQGIPSPTNEPPSIYEAVEFKDASGNLWIFGGVGAGSYCDLWKYDPAANLWTWMKGSGVAGDPGVFGTIGVPNAANYPPGLGYGSASWTDLNGNFWVFGGSGFTGNMNTMWRYEPSTNNWTWMNGSNTGNPPGVYGTQGVPGPLNTPGGRLETACAWTDNAGDLWLFGGTTSGGNMNDLWRYTVATNEWTWMKGSQAAAQAGTYGTRGVEDPANTPGARQVYSRWKDLTGNLWLFSGGDYPTNLLTNDMWRYNRLTNNWAWMDGNNTPTQTGLYGTKCVADSNNVPESRFENRAVVTDVNGNFWMFGGGTGGGSIPEVWNDLWIYCTGNNRWAWVGNDTTVNPAGNWGTMGVTAPTNIPNGRSGHVLWNDNAGHLYFFGGSANGWNTPFQDIWKYNIDNSCIPCNSLPTALFTAPHHICPGTCTSFNNNSINSTSWLWIFQGGSPSTSTEEDPDSICFYTPGQYDVTLIATNINGSDTLTLPNYITVYPFSPPQTIQQNGDSLISNPGFVAYQWFYDGDTIPGATNTYYIATQSGDYSLICYDNNGCIVEVVVLNVTADVTGPGGKNILLVYPNPARNQLDIQRETGIEPADITIFNAAGERIPVNHVPSSSAGSGIQSLDISQLPPGVYFLEINSGKKVLRARFIKQ